MRGGIPEGISSFLGLFMSINLGRSLVYNSRSIMPNAHMSTFYVGIP
jgi:hypothetical protein